MKVLNPSYLIRVTKAYSPTSNAEGINLKAGQVRKATKLYADSAVMWVGNCCLSPIEYTILQELPLCHE